MFKFDLIVEVFDDESGYTYVLEEMYMYDAISKGLFTRVCWAHINDELIEVNTGNAIKTQIEEIEITYDVNEYVLDHYLSTDINATSGTQSGSKFNLGETIYLFIKKPLNTAQYEYSVNEYEYEKLDEQWYRQAIYVHQDNADLYTIYVNRQLQNYEIIFKSYDGTEICKSLYGYGSNPEYYGDDKHLLRAEDEKYTYEFVGWNPLITTVVEDATYITRFIAIPKEYIVSILSSENGVVNHINENNIITCEDAFTYIFIPNEGYVIKDVKINGVSVGAVSNYTFKNVTRNQTISVEYEIKKFNILLSVEGQGSLTSNKTLENVAYGEDIIFTISTQEGWELSKVYINGKSINIFNDQLVVSYINEDINILAIFKENEKVATFSFNTTDIAIIVGTIIISILLIVLIVKSHKNTKKRKIEASMQKVIVPENQPKVQKDHTLHENPYQMPTQNSISQTKTTMFRKALEFVKSREQHFILFCNKYKIDYQNDYNNAVLRYYQAYLRSLKK